MSGFEEYWKTAKRTKQEYPSGTRLVLIHMEDRWAPVPPGTRGTVSYVDDIGQIGVKWDNGQTLSLFPEEDSFRKLTSEELEEERNNTENNRKTDTGTVDDGEDPVLFI